MKRDEWIEATRKQSADDVGTLTKLWDGVEAEVRKARPTRAPAESNRSVARPAEKGCAEA